MHRILIITPALLSLLCAACDRGERPGSEAIAVKVAVVERASVSPSAHYSAQIVPETKVDLAFKVGGYVDTIAMVPGVDQTPRPLQGGDAVLAGQRLATVRRTEYQLTLAESQAAYAQSVAGSDQARLDYQRSSILADENAAPVAEVDATRNKRRGAIASSRGAKARRDRAMVALEDTVLRAPLDGVVINRTIEIGTLAAPGMVAFAIGDIGKVKAVFGVPDSVLPKLHLGDSETCTSDAYPGVKFIGKISFIAVSADPRSRVFEVDVTIPNPDGKLRLGSVVSLSLEAIPDAALPLIPLAAITRSPTHPDKFAVYVIEGEGAKTIVRAHEVELGEYLGRVIPVKSGLVGGERIVVQGTGLVSDGETVEVLP